MADGGRGNDRGEREEKEAEEGERFFVFPSSNNIGPCLPCVSIALKFDGTHGCIKSCYGKDVSEIGSLYIYIYKD